MLNEVLKYLNRYYKTTDVYTKDVTFTADDTLTADFTDTLIASEYFLVEGTRLNDGVYKVSANNTTSITIDTTVDLAIISEPEIATTITRLDIPRELLSLVEEIKTYNNGVVDGVSSETQGSRSVSYESGSSWQNAFSTRLSKYKKLRWC